MSLKLALLKLHWSRLPQENNLVSNKTSMGEVFVITKFHFD